MPISTSSTPRLAWVSVGANLGDRRHTIAQTLLWLDRMIGVRLELASAIFEYEAVGPPQPAYLNAAVRLATTLAPMELLDGLQGLERAAGRVRRQIWGPRTLDLDLLMYEGLVMASARLTLPHPHMHARRFVLEPLASIDPDLVHLRLDRSVASLLQALP